MLRVGKITYANCTPIFDGLEHMDLPDVEIVTGVPSELNQALAQGNIDLCISSSIEYPRHADEYLILPDFCIGSDGPVWSVLLVSTLPLSELEGTTIFVTSESATSVIMLQVLLTRFVGLKKVTVVPTHQKLPEALASAPAVLLIGDQALQAYLAPPAGVIIHDLGELWRTYTGLPFVYALWLVQRESIQQKKVALDRFAHTLHLVHREMDARAEEVSEAATERSWIEPQQLVAYWTHAIQYGMSEQHTAGLSCFYRHAFDLGFISSLPNLNFYRQ